MISLREVIGRTLTRARNAPMPPGSTTLSRIESNTTDLFARVERHHVEHHEAGETGRLTAEAMREDRARLLEELQQDAAGLIQDTRERIDAYRERLEAAMKPAYEPTEERLANARSDARMVLDGATRETMARELADLAEDGDNAVRYLLLMTPWVTYYLRGRGLETLVGMWNTAKVRFMAEVLTADGMRAFQSLDTVADLAEITLRQRNIIDWYRKDLPAAPVVTS